MLEQGKRVRSPPPEAETTWDELTTTPIPMRHLGEGRETGSKVKPGKKGGVEGRFFKIQFLFLIILF